MTITKRLTIAAVLGLGFALTAVPAYAQPKGVARLKAQIANTPKIITTSPDLAVTKFQGLLDGADYVLGGTVHNNGPTDYFRTVSVAKNAPPQGRRVELFVVLNGGLGKGGSTQLLRSILLPAIKSGQDFVIPTMRIPASQVPGPATAQFVLKISGSDRDSSNDWQQTIVSTVR